MPKEIIRPGKIIDLVNIYNEIDGKWYCHQIVEDETLADIKTRNEQHWEDWSDCPDGLVKNGNPPHAFMGVTKTIKDVVKEPEPVEPKQL
jgi:hypothetical protein